MSKIKFVKITEIVKPGRHSDQFLGVEISRDKEKVCLIGIDLSDCDDIDVVEVDAKAYKFENISKERVHHYFTIAAMKQQTYLIDAEMNLIKAKRNFKFNQDKLKEYFGGPIKAEEKTI